MSGIVCGWQYSKSTCNHVYSRWFSTHYLTISSTGADSLIPYFWCIYYWRRQGVWSLWDWVKPHTCSSSTPTSVLDCLRAPRASDLARRREVKANPPLGKGGAMLEKAGENSRLSLRQNEWSMYLNDSLVESGIFTYLYHLMYLILLPVSCTTSRRFYNPWSFCYISECILIDNELVNSYLSRRHYIGDKDSANYLYNGNSKI